MKFIPFVCAILVATPALADPAIIRSQSDLPEQRFILDAKPSLAYSDAAFLQTTVPALRLAAERLLAGYRVEDPSISQQLRVGLAAIAVLQGRPVDADRLIAEQRRAVGSRQWPGNNRVHKISH